MKRAALGLLCLLVLPAAVFADSLNSISPSSFLQNDIEQFATLQGTGLEGTVSTQIVLSGPAGTFTTPSSGGSGDGTVLYLNIPDVVLSAAGNVSVTVQAIDSGGTRTIGPVFFTVVATVTQQPPLLSIPEVVVAEATSPAGANVTYTASGFSFVDPGPPAVVCNHPSGSLFPVTTTTVTCTATDSFASTSGTFVVNVTDTVPPVLTLPSNIVTSNPVVSYTVTATDTVDTNPLVSCSPASGSTFIVGTTTVLCSATDAHANRTTGSFKVTVTGGATAPLLTLPGDILAEASGPAGAVVSYVVTATDNASISCSPASGSTFPLG
ncbi:MAG TPA: HYR domain-containing protein, partial [Thermoanaerobaculia bacterium]|nr:HYR domain-containing protein [Thermoanaerobaculia bacterium]